MSSLKLATGAYSVVGYDNLDRAIYTGEWKTALDSGAARAYFGNVQNRNSPIIAELTPGTITRTFYDRMPARDTLGVELYPATVPADAFRYGRTRTVAVISDVSADSAGNVIRVSTANSYDKYGRVTATYAYDPTAPADSLKMLAVETEYDLGGKVTRTTKYPYGVDGGGASRKIVERYTYDRLGRIDSLFSKNGGGDETLLARYEYYPTGSVKSVHMGNILTIVYTYHISGALRTARVTTANGAEWYSEMLHYEDCGDEECTPQYNGNISYMAQRIAHSNRDFVQNREVAYYYDQLNRLTKTDDLSQDYFDDFFEYDAQGRITVQRRAEKIVASSGGEYAYYDSTNKLKNVADGMGGTAGFRNMGDAQNFVYDRDGNLIEDKSKNMMVVYDWRGMPTEFTQQPSGGSSHATRLVMMYDGSGRRVSKTSMRKAGDGDWDTTLVTHYTGIGTEVRENFEGPAPETKVVVNMPQGLGRYGIENADHVAENGSAQTFEWYLKNHLGSTMLVYGTSAGMPGGLLAAYDYRSFGEQVSLTESADKVTENFTGKERDDETQLNYFGARYLEPMLGMWTSVDPMRQHFSPYTYGNNNPIARIDPDGNADLRMAVFYNRDQNGKVLPPNLKQDVDRALSGALNPRYDTYEVKYFGENASAEEISNFINGGDFGAIAMHGEIDADGIFIAHDMDGNYIDAYDLKFNVKTLLGACHSEAFIRFEDETGNLVAPKYDENGMTKSFVESINFLINNSDTKNPYRIDIMGGIKD